MLRPSPLWEPLLVVMLAVYPSVYIATLLHEVGHALAGIFAGYTVTLLGLGTGRCFFKMRLPGGAILYLCRDNRLFGSCWTTTEEIIVPNSRQALLLLGGGGFNLIMTLCLCLLWKEWRSSLFLVGAGANLFVALLNLLPHRQPNSSGTGAMAASDGHRLFTLLMTRHQRTVVPETLLTYRALWGEIGDMRTTRYQHCLAAAAALRLHDVESATQYSAIVQVLIEANCDGLAAFIRGGVAFFDPEERRDALIEAREEFLTHKAFGSAFLTELGLLESAPTTKEAIHQWEQIRAEVSPSLKRNPVVAYGLIFNRLLLFFSDPQGNQETLETLLARYEAVRRQYYADTGDTKIYSRVARWRKEHGDPAGAQIAWERATRAIHVVDAALTTDSGLRQRYRERWKQEATEAKFPSPFAV